MNDSENGKEGVSKGKNTAKIKGKDDKKKRNRTKVVENVSLTPGYQLFSADDSTVLTKLLPSQRRSERVMQEKRGRIRTAAGSHNGSTSSTTTVDSGVPVEDVAFSQYEDDTFLLKVLGRHAVCFSLVMICCHSHAVNPSAALFSPEG